MNANDIGQAVMVIPLQGTEGYAQESKPADYREYAKIMPDGFTTSANMRIRLEKPEGDKTCTALVVNFTHRDIHIGWLPGVQVVVNRGRSFLLELERGRQFGLVLDSATEGC